MTNLRRTGYAPELPAVPHALEPSRVPPPLPTPFVSPLPMANAVLRHVRLLVLLPLAVFALAVVPPLLGRRDYVSTSTFAPQAAQAARSNLSGLAAQFGISLSSSDAMLSPAFYAELVKSRELLGGAVDARYEFQADTGLFRGTLVQYYNMEGATEAERREGAIDALANATDVVVGLKTGVIRLSVTTKYPALSKQIADALLTLVNEFNLKRRQSQAAAERSFVANRLEEVRGELRAAENRLQSFAQSNRTFGAASQLNLEQERLSREVSMRQSVYTSLAQAYEQAKVDEVRDTPVITVVERPTLPVRPKSRKLVVRGMLALMLGAILAVLLVLFMEFLRASRERDPDNFATFQALRRSAWATLLPLPRRRARRDARPA